MHFGIHNDDQKGFSVMKKTGKSRRDQGLANKVDERAELHIICQTIVPAAFSCFLY